MPHPSVPAEAAVCGRDLPQSKANPSFLLQDVYKRQEFVKVYLLLLRHLNDPSVSRDISGIADILDCTEKDVIRALKDVYKRQYLSRPIRTRIMYRCAAF